MQPLLPYARQFCAAPSRCSWYDGSGTAHEIVQGEDARPFFWPFSQRHARLKAVCRIGKARQALSDHIRGWQRHAARSQAGPHSALASTVAPTHEGVVIPSAQFWVYVLRLCGCHGRLDAHAPRRHIGGPRLVPLEWAWRGFAARQEPALPAMSGWPR